MIIDDELIKKYLAFISPNITELISYYDDFINYNDVSNLLKSNNFNIDNLHNDDIISIQEKINKNIEKFDKETPKDTDLKNIKKKDYDFKTDNALFDIEKLPKFYSEYLENKQSIDNEQNRLIYLQKQIDNGFYHFIEVLKDVINTEYDTLKSINYDKDLETFTKEYKRLENEQKKYKNDCKQIKISKFYYNEAKFKADEGNKQEFEGSYVLLNNDTNVYSVLYLMKNGNWEKQFTLSSDEKNSIKICDGSYYFDKIKSNDCLYDDIEELCKNKVFIIMIAFSIPGTIIYQFLRYYYVL